MRLGSTPSGHIDHPPILTTTSQMEEEGDVDEFSIIDNTESITKEHSRVAGEQKPTKVPKKSKKTKSTTGDKKVKSSGTEKKEHGAKTKSSKSKKKSKKEKKPDGDDPATQSSVSQQVSQEQPSVLSKRPPMDPLDAYLYEDQTSKTAELSCDASFSLSEESPHVWCQPRDQAAFVELDIRRLNGEFEKRLTYN